jgi:CRISPR/Cas system Type II protein with McrA/HNH and RuvC-like nuclease domain
MKSVNWGKLYNNYKDRNFDAKRLETEVLKLMKDEDVTKKSGIYFYLITNETKYLNLRAFTPNQKREAYERQKGICPVCGNHFEFEEMQGDHIIPWSEGGKTTTENCQMLCIKDNREKSNK